MLKGSYNWQEENKRKEAEKRRSKAAESLDGIVNGAVRHSQIHVAGDGTVHDYTESEVHNFPTDGATALKPEDYTSPQQPIPGNVLPFATQEEQAIPRQGGGGSYSGGGTTTVRGGLHVPGWAYAAGGGLLIMAALAYGAVRLAAATPEASNATPVPTVQVTAPPPVQTATPTATVMPGLENLLTDEQIRQYVNEWYVNELKGPQLITPEMVNKIEAAKKSLYFQLIGQTFESSNFEIKLLTRKEYDKSVPDYLKGTEGTIDASNYAYVDRNGKVNVFGKIYVKAVSHIGEEGNSLNVLMTLARETGQAEQIRLFWKYLAENDGKALGIKDYSAFYQKVAEKNNLGDISDLLSELGDILVESNQTLYEAAAFHKLEEIGALTLASPHYNEQTGSEEVDDLIASNHFFLRASVVGWSKALNNTDARLSLQTNGEITSQQALNLFNESVRNTFTIGNYEKEVVDAVKAVRTAQEYAQPIKDAAKLSRRTGLGVLFP